MTNQSKYAYDKGAVGLVHSEAVHVLRESLADEQDFSESVEELASKSVRYELPVTIGTVDHLLMSLYHGFKYADRAFGNLLTALVVFDEIHAYDTVTLSAIREGLAVLVRYRIPTLFMSATLPPSRRKFLGLPDERTIIELDNPYRPFELIQIAAALTSGGGFALQASYEACQLIKMAEGLKLAVYVNQVERAKALARAAERATSGVPVFCYHSELAPRDRQDLESRIISAFDKDEPAILVATQAAELSLDISAEQMIAELAPADVVVQRGGRLHRRGMRPFVGTSCQCALCKAARNRVCAGRSFRDERGQPAAGFHFHLMLAPLDLAEATDGGVPGALPYGDADLLRKTWDQAPWQRPFTFDIGCAWCETVLHGEPEAVNVGLEAAAAEDVVFGRRPQENRAGSEGAGAVVIRDIDDAIMHVIPERSALDLPSSVVDLAELYVPLRMRKFKVLERAGFIERQTRQFVVGDEGRSEPVGHDLFIVKAAIPYSPLGGGFDFSVLSQQVIEPKTGGAFF
jgi:CRISPR-associated endonuclease/helicase Cas3